MLSYVVVLSRAFGGGFGCSCVMMSKVVSARVNESRRVTGSRHQAAWQKVEKSQFHISVLKFKLKSKCIGPFLCLFL